MRMPKGGKERGWRVGGTWVLLTGGGHLCDGGVSAGGEQPADNQIAVLHSEGDRCSPVNGAGGRKADCRASEEEKHTGRSKTA